MLPGSQTTSWAVVPAAVCTSSQSHSRCRRHTEAPSALKVPSAQGSHSGAPTRDANVPAAHGSHTTSLVGVPASATKVPASHVDHAWHAVSSRASWSKLPSAQVGPSFWCAPAAPPSSPSVPPLAPPLERPPVASVLLPPSPLENLPPLAAPPVAVPPAPPLD